MTRIASIFIGLVLSAIILGLLTLKWKMPWRPALQGLGGAVIIATVSAIWFYGRLDTPWNQMAGIVGQPSLALLVGLFWVMARFWRDPERTPPPQENTILSAADGQIIYIREVDEHGTPLITKSGRDYSLTELTGTDLLKQPVYVIGVEMSFLDVHVNRCPIAGHVELLEFIQGKFISLRKDEAPFVNERFTTIIQNGALTVGVVQVASRLVRCIRNYLSLGKLVQSGERLGVIRLGSLVAIIVPKEGVTLEVKPGDRVTAGISVLARHTMPRKEAQL